MVAIDPQEWARWWRTRGAREATLILWALWDPIGCGVPPDEYESYPDRLAGLLRDRAPADELAARLKSFRVEWMGDLEHVENRDLDTAEKLQKWYDSVWPEER